MGLLSKLWHQWQNKTGQEAVRVQEVCQSVPHYINHRRLTSGSGLVAEVFNPATGVAEKEVGLANSEEVHLAVQAAKGALGNWAKTTPSHRAKILFQYKTLLEGHRQELAAAIVAEQGKLLSDALGEVDRGIDVVAFACGAPYLLNGQYAHEVSHEVDSYNFRSPVGVVVGITPFNFPVMVPLWMAPLAIVCGNTFILKPSEQTPSAALLLADLFQQAGLPEGVFNVLQGDQVAVEGLIAHADVAAVSFVGSTAVAEKVYALAAKHHKRVQALGSAKNHIVVMPDAPLDDAVNALVGAAFGAAGERCMAAAVAVVVGDVAPALLAKLKAKVASVHTGVKPEGGVYYGPLISQSHLDQVGERVSMGVAEGAELLIDGRDCVVEGHEQGYFMGPCLFDFVTPNMSIYQQELFGPVLCVVRVPHLEAALDLINQCAYANGSSIFTQSGRVAHEFVAQVEVGMVGVNVPIPVPMAFHSFGGWKNSLFGDLAMYGQDGIRFYTRTKNVTTRWHEPVSGSAFDLPS
ncbi:MAG: CoA-acylating methylmalonate-semialdehyde dehydrogenase [Neisseriaceae bacterium]|nr:CoA-acylating methylmalonate-semialdehyde dehydrogenase [Neisseriaceae bacterium]